MLPWGGKAAQVSQVYFYQISASRMERLTARYLAGREGDLPPLDSPKSEARIPTAISHLFSSSQFDSGRSGRPR